MEEITLELQRKEKEDLEMVIVEAITKFKNNTGLIVDDIKVLTSTARCGYVQTVKVKTDLT